MKAVMVMFDSLNRHLLPPYGCDWTHAPNFARLARRAATFDRSYICSMPCMPARRDFHTGRPNLLFDVQADPRQARAVQDAAAEQRLCAALARHFAACAAPPEQYARIGLPAPAAAVSGR